MSKRIDRPPAPAQKQRPAKPATKKAPPVEEPPVDLPSERSPTTASAYTLEPAPQKHPKPASTSASVSNTNLGAAKKRLAVATTLEQFRKIGVAAREEMSKEFEVVKYGLRELGKLEPRISGDIRRYGLAEFSKKHPAIYKGIKDNGLIKTAKKHPWIMNNIDEYGFDALIKKEPELMPRIIEHGLTELAKKRPNTVNIIHEVIVLVKEEEKKEPVKTTATTPSRGKKPQKKLEEMSGPEQNEAARIVATAHAESRFCFLAVSQNGEAKGLLQFQRSANEKGEGAAWDEVTKTKKFKTIWEKISGSKNTPPRGSSIWADVLAFVIWQKTHAAKEGVSLAGEDLKHEKILRLRYKLTPKTADRMIDKLRNKGTVTFEDRKNQMAFNDYISILEAARSAWPEMKKAAGISN